MKVENNFDTNTSSENDVFKKLINPMKQAAKSSEICRGLPQNAIPRDFGHINFKTNQSTQ